MTNGTNDREELKGFLEAEFAAVEETGVVSGVILYHHAHTGAVEVHNMKVGHGKWNKPAEMAHTFDSVAVRHARGIAGGGAQQFELSVIRGDGERASAVLPFVRVGPSSFTGPGGSLATEPPTPIGLTQQSQRWGEQITQMAFAAMQHLSNAQQRAIDGREASNERLEKINADLWIACKALLLELDKRRHDEKMSELSAARLAEFQKQAMILAPALINMMAGKEVFPLSAADTSTLDTIAAFATPDDLRMLTAGLAAKPGGAEIAAVLADRFDQYHKRKATEAAAEQRLLRNLPDRSYEEAERDAAGEAIRALRGQPAGAIEPRPAPKALNGHSTHTGVVPKTPGTDPDTVKSEDTELVEGLVARVPEGQLDMLTEVLGAADPEFGAKLKARLAALKKR